MVSVIVPVYKVEKYLRCCVDSILSQTYSDIELILVDDGSPDQCGAICDEYARKDSRVKVIHKTNGGVSSARNAGLDIATGAYLTFCDSDDSYEPDWIQALVSAIEQENADVAVGCLQRVLENGTELPVTPMVANTVSTVSREEKIAYCYHYLFGYRHNWEACARMYRSSIVIKNHIRFCETCGNFAEDLGFTLVCALYAQRTVSISNAGYRYLMREDSMMRNSEGNAKLNSVNEVAVYFSKAYRESFDEKDTLHALPVLHFLLMYDQYQVILSQDRMEELGKYLESIQNQQAWLSFTKALPSCYGTMKRHFGAYNARRILMLAHYTRHRSWPRYDLERRIFYKLNKPKS